MPLPPASSTASLRSSSSWSSLSILAPPSDLLEIECLLPNGIVLEAFVHPDEELCRIKEVVLAKATSDGKVALGGCLSPDASHYVVSYVSKSGQRQECLDETRTLTQIRPFLNVLKFDKKTKDQQHYVFKHHLGKQE